jgi:hypothetical protein
MVKEITLTNVKITTINVFYHNMNILIIIVINVLNTNKNIYIVNNYNKINIMM